MERSVDEIWQEYTALSNYYSARNSCFDDDDRYYELDFVSDLGLPKEFERNAVVMPTARDMVDAGSDHVSTVYAKFFRPTRGLRKEDRDQAEMLRKFDAGLFYRTKLEAPISPWRVASKHAFLYGMWAWEVVYDPDRPEEAIPIVIRAIHPHNVYPDNMDYPNFVILTETKSVVRAQQEWPNWSGPKNTKVKQVVQVIYWDGEHRAILVDKEPVLTGTNEEKATLEHNYKCIPVVTCYSGLGNMDIDATPEARCVGLIRYLKGPLKAQSFAYSAKNIEIMAGCWPISFATGPGAKQLASMQLKYGQIYELPPGTELKEFIPSPPPGSIDNHLDYTTSVLNASGSPRVLRGLAEGGVRSGIDRSIVLSQARLKYDSILEQMQNGTSKVMGVATHIAENVLPKNVRVWAHNAQEDFEVEIDKSKIKEHYTTYVEFSPTNPDDDARAHADAINMSQAGLLTPYTARKLYLTNVDPNDEEIRMEAFKLRNNPQVEQILASIMTTKLQIEAIKLQKIAALKAGVITEMTKMEGAAELGMPPEQFTSLTNPGVSQAMQQFGGGAPATGGGALMQAPGPGGSQAIQAQKRLVPGPAQSATPQPGSPEWMAQQTKPRRKVGGK